MPSPWREASEAHWKARLRLTPEEQAAYLNRTLTLTSLAATYGVSRAAMLKAVKWAGIYQQRRTI